MHACLNISSSVIVAGDRDGGRDDSRNNGDDDIFHADVRMLLDETTSMLFTSKFKTKKKRKIFFYVKDIKISASNRIFIKRHWCSR